MFGTLTTIVFGSLVCFSALLAVPAACIVILAIIMATANDGARPIERTAGPGRLACSALSACVKPLPDDLPATSLQRTLAARG